MFLSACPSSGTSRSRRCLVRGVLPVLLGILALPLQSQAKAGESAIGTTVLYSLSSAVPRSHMGILMVSYSYYLIDKFEVGIAPSVTQSSTTNSREVDRSYVTYSTIKVGKNTIQVPTTHPLKGSVDETTKATSSGMFLFQNYYPDFGTSKIRPFGGVSYFRADLGNSNDKGCLGLNVGFKYLLREKFALNAQATYLNPINGSGDCGSFLLGLGISGRL